jgi:GntR family transcriptional regulator, transcriptional repressor for pyruvate dehydrogenase complex
MTLKEKKMFNSVTNKKVYEHVIEQIQNMVLNGSLQNGDKLPSERDLSEKMEVSRTSIREAIRVLETMGVIESRQGEGNFVCSNINASFIEPLSMIFMLNNGEPSDILELRKAIELVTVRFAAQRGSEEDFEELKDMIYKLKTSDTESERVLIDTKIHQKIATMSGNYLIESVFITASTLFERFVKNARESILYSNDRLDILMVQHEDIVNAIIERNGDKAFNAMKEHLDFIDDYINKMELK